MSARSHWPGFWAALFLVLLRMSIGWHFLYEGLWKYGQYEKPFSAEGYFRASAGPLSPYFRSQVPDVDGLEALHRDASGLPDHLKADWAGELDAYAKFYGFDGTQLEKARAVLTASEAAADAWFRDRTNADRVTKYAADLEDVVAIERDPQALESQRVLAQKDRKKLNTERIELLAVLNGWTDDLRKSWTGLATEEQIAKAPQPRPGILRTDFRKASSSAAPTPMGRLDWLNTATVYLLILAGGGLLLGLFTRLSALACAAFLALIYLSLPPWPGMPENPLSEGHYLYVSKNLIELIACLLIAVTPSGHWIGLDALLFGARRRRKLAAAEERAAQLDS